MALQSVTFPRGLYTDCNSVRLGLLKGPVWAQSAKRKFARVWSSLAAITEEAQETIHWIPAHTPESSIGCVRCSDDTWVDEIKWKGNQMVDTLARDAAESVRIPVSARVRLLRREFQLREFVIYLGKLTSCCQQPPWS